MKHHFFCYLVIAATSAVPLSVAAHEGHGNTPWHAVMHMLEQNGAVIGLLLLVGIGTLAWRAQQKRKLRDQSQCRQESHRDSR